MRFERRAGREGASLADRVRVKRTAIILVAVVLALGGALLAFRAHDPLGFIDARREARIALGLPKLWVRDYNHDTRGEAALACPADALVIVTGGQSNAANALSDPLPADAALPAFMALGGKCYRLRDPVLGATSTGGSLWTAMGAALHRASGRPVVFINGAVGGSQLGDWLDDRSGYRQHLAAEVVAARRAGLVPGYVFWVQGETDAFVLVDPALFVDQLRRLMPRLDAATGRVPWLVYRSTRCTIRRGNGPAIDAAVTAFAATSDRAILGPDASALGPDKRRDGCHFNAAGRDLLVAETVAIIGPRLQARRAFRPAMPQSGVPASR